MTLTFEGFKVHIDNQGYPRFWLKKLVMVHRYVYEREHGPIPAGMDIHHKDFNKLNWALDNLVLLTHPEHMEIHRRQGLIEKGINPDTHAYCWRCRSVKVLADFASDSSRGDGKARQCKTCSSQHLKEYSEKNSGVLRQRRRKYYERLKADPVKMAKRRERLRDAARERYRRKKTQE